MATRDTHFVLLVAASWLDAAAHADRMANLTRSDDEEANFWDRKADRYENQSKLVTAYHHKVYSSDGESVAV